MISFSTYKSRHHRTIDYAIRAGISIVIVLLVFSSAISHQSSLKSPGKYDSRVLVLHSYHQGFQNTDDVSQGIIAAFESASEEIKLCFEFLDSKRFYTPEYFRSMLDVYRLKYSAEPPTVIICSDDFAFEFLRKFGAEVFPGTPVVYCGLSGIEASSSPGQEVTGVMECLDIKGTLDLALRCHQDVKRITVVSDPTLTGQALKKKARAVFRDYQHKLSFRYLDTLTFKEYERELESLTEDELVFWLLLVRDRNGEVLSPEVAMKRLIPHCAVPSYGIWFNYLGYGIVGGKLTDGFSNGKLAASLALRIIKGEKASSIPPVESSSRFMLDYKLIKRFGIKKNALPDNSVIVNQPSSTYRQYKAAIISGAIIIVILLVIVTALIGNTLRRRRAENKLLLMQFALDHASDPVFWMDSQGKFFYVNRAACDTLDYNENELLAMSVHDIDPDFPPETWKTNWRRIKKLKSAKTESQLQAKDGRIIPVEISANYLKFGDKELNCAYARDISNRKFAEQTEAVLYKMANAVSATKDLDELLQQIRALLSEVVDTTNFYIALYDKTSGTITLPYIKDEKDRFTAFPAGKTLTAYVIKTNTPLLVREKEILKMVESGEIETIGSLSKVWLGVPLRIKDDIIGIVALQSYTDETKYTDKDLKILEFVSEQIAVAIERKRTEDIIRDNEQFLHSVFDGIQDGICVMDTDFNVIRTNLWMEKMYASKMPLTGKKCYDAFQERDSICPWCPSIKTIKTGEVKNAIVPYTNQANPTGWIGLSSFPLKDAEGKVVGVIKHVKDITQSKIAEEALRESEEKYRTLTENSLQGIALIKANPLRFVFVNTVVSQILGRSLKEILALPQEEIRQIIHTEEREELFERLAKRLQGDTSLTKYEFRIINKKGEIRWLEVLSNLIEYGGEPAIQATFADVTERKQAEAALRVSEEKYGMLFRDSRDAVYISTKEGKFLDVNDAAVDLFGYTKEEMLNLDIETIYLDPEDRVNFKNEIESAGSVKDFEVKLLKKDGTVMDCLVSATIRKSSKGKILGYQGIIHDITARKEAALMQHVLYKIASSINVTQDLDQLFSYIREQLSAIIDTANFYIALYDKKTDTIALPYVMDEKKTIKQFPAKKTFTNYVIQHDKPLLVSNDDIMMMVKTGEVEIVGPAAKVWLGVPLKTANEVIGALVVQSYVESNAYDEKDLELLRFVSEQIAIAIQRKRADETMRESEEKYRSLIEQSNDAIYLLVEEKFEVINRKFSEMFGVSYKEVKSPDFDFMNLVAPESRPLIEERDSMIDQGEEPPSQYEFTALTKAGVKIEVQASVNYVEFRGRIATQGILRDITVTKQLEAQLRQAQKMEAVGQLAGGVAHDFNNLMTAVIGNCELAMMSVSGADPLYERFREIHKAGESAANLTSQLLAYSRKQALEPKVVDLNKVITKMDKMLRRVIGEDIDLATVLGEDLWKVKVDPGQVEQVVVNLAINARDAMPYGGNLTIELSNHELKDKYAKTHPQMTSGDYVMLAITDTGIGMNEEVKSRIFEPFFTTKELGKGTGLGLSMVYGIIKQSGGNIWVYSESGQGTTFRIYFPRALGEDEEVEQKAVPEDLPRGEETILLVEDDECVRQLALEILNMQGYRVFSAENGEEAYRLCQAMKKPVELVITDVIMPNIGGIELYEKLNRLWPGVKVIFMSGYAPNSMFHRKIFEPGKSYIQKPFNSVDLVQKVREALDS